MTACQRRSRRLPPMALACLVLAGIVPANGSDGRFADATQAAEHHREAVASAMRVIDEAEARGKAIPDRLLRIRREIPPRLSWGRIREDDTMIALDAGKRDGVWGIVIEPGHRAMDESFPTLTSLTLDGIQAIRIRPDRMSPRWSGVFMVHEFSHVLDAWDGEGDAPACAGEFAAYVVERQYYDLANGDRLSEGLDRVIDTLGFKHPRDVVALYLADADRLAQAMATLKRTLDEPSEASAAEREMRDGFYYVSLVDRVGLRAGLAEEARCNAMLDAMKPASKY